MCRRKQSCSELGGDPATWSRRAPLMPPDWFRAQLPLFADAVRLAAEGEAESARTQLGRVRARELQDWYIEHAQMAGRFRKMHFGTSQPATEGVDLDPLRSPQRFTKTVLRRDGYHCRYCGVGLVPKQVLQAFGDVVGRDAFGLKGRNVERHGVVLAFRANVDHVVPWAQGGRTDMDNLVSCCWGCNYGKSNYTLEEIGLDDPRHRPVGEANGWDGLTSLLPALRAVARRQAAGPSTNVDADVM